MTDIGDSGPTPGVVIPGRTLKKERTGMARSRSTDTFLQTGCDGSPYLLGFLDRQPGQSAALHKGLAPRRDGKQCQLFDTGPSSGKPNGFRVIRTAG
jgi:hypothetical protein